MMIIQVPGSKSITNRALLCAALAQGISTIKHGLASDDTEIMWRALAQLGVNIHKRKNVMRVKGGLLERPDDRVYCGNAGTVLRFLSAVLATQAFPSILDGDKRMRERPIKDLVDALRQMGASIEYLGAHGYSPFLISHPLRGGKTVVSGSVSSQFLSGLLLAAPLAKKTISIHIRGKLVSKPYADLTLEVMKKFGITVRREAYRKFVIPTGQKYRPAVLEVEGDASAASYFWGIAALTEENIEIPNIPKNSSQADMRFRRAAERIARGGRQMLQCGDFPDSAMTLAVLCAFYKGRFRLTGLSNLRIKESNRLAALVKELRKIGADARELPDGIEIAGNPDNLHGAVIQTYNDHRMAMCFGMASVILPRLRIENPSCVKKTYPQFWKDLALVKKKLSGKNIVLTGMRGSGKTKLGKILADAVKRPFYDIDKEVERRAGTAISEIVEKKGWGFFRKLERDEAERLSHKKGCVIATGGGTLLYSANARALKKNGCVIFLKCPVEVLKKRIEKSRNRPSLNSKKHFLDELALLYKKRKKTYHAVSDVIVEEHDFQKKLGILKKIMQRLGMLL